MMTCRHIAASHYASAMLLAVSYATSFTLLPRGYIAGCATLRYCCQRLAAAKKHTPLAFALILRHCCWFFTCHYALRYRRATYHFRRYDTICMLHLPSSSRLLIDYATMSLPK